MELFTNGKVSFGADMALGRITELKFNSDSAGMNYLISPDILRKYEFDDMGGCLLGATRLSYCGHELDTGLRIPDKTEIHKTGSVNTGVSFSYELNRIRLTHTFTLDGETMRWKVRLQNTHSRRLELDQLMHWMPTGYVMHKTIEENLNHSCAMVPSITGSRPYVICKKRSGKGRNLIVYNETGGMKSVGSECRFTNLFFEKSSPSLNGLVLFSTVNAYRIADKRPPEADWQYGEMYEPVCIDPGGFFEDSYIFTTCEDGNEKECVLGLGGTIVDFEPDVFCGQKALFTVKGPARVAGCRVYAANKSGVYEEKLDVRINANTVTAGPFTEPGERKAVFRLDDGTESYVIFAVYESIKTIIDAICDHIYSDRFVSDPSSPEYCAYKSISLQGESCAKGTLLLLKNLLSGNPDPAQVKQVELNTVNFVKPNWLDDNFIPLKKYPGGFARMIDFSYIIPQFYLLSKFDGMLELNSADTYLMWTYKLSVYSLEDTPDKSQRERDEMDRAFIPLWNTDEIISDLVRNGHKEEAEKLRSLIAGNTKKQEDRDTDRAIITEHHFDNAGLSMRAEYYLRHGMEEKGMQVASLLLPNVADSNDYRNFTPDRWWEALAPMYHNLWCVYPAKAMLSAYEVTRDKRYLLSAYRGMVPMFYNYDWNAVSAIRELKKGEGVSSYCLTAPNLNLDFASHNRFGQSVFRGVFFDRLQLAGDDWDMGMDVVIYLKSFGQEAYVTMKDGAPYGVNAALSGTLDDMTVETFAPYGGKYFIEPFDLTVCRGNTNFTIDSIRIKNGECTAVSVRGSGEPEILAGKKGALSRIYPVINKSTIVTN